MDMLEEERRKHTRMDSLNLVSYVCVDENNQVLSQGMGRTLNVTEGGILLETHAPIEQQHIVLVTVGLKDDLVDIKGKVIHHRKGEGGEFNTGIEFIETDASALRILKDFIVAFKKQQYTSKGHK